MKGVGAGWLVVLASCGRIGFDPRGDGSSDAANDIAGDGAIDSPPMVAWPVFSAPTLSSASSTLDDFYPELSRDGTFLLYSAYAGGCGNDDVVHTSRPTIDMPFTPPAMYGSLCTSGRDTGPTLSSDTLTMMYASGATGFAEPTMIFESTRLDSTASFMTPSAVLGVSAGGFTRDPELSADGLTLYFDSNRTGGAGSCDLWVTTRPDFGSAWITPVSITELNTAACERDPSVSSDGLMLYFASDRAGGAGAQDLWVTIRANTSLPWEPPRNLTELNTASSEGSPTISDVGRILFDTTRTGGPGGTFGYDLYEASRQ